jgi:glutamate/tyrosine decarboxylase-like PLP-dependent enzyme
LHAELAGKLKENKKQGARIATGKTPFCVMGSVATVNTGSIDDLAAIAEVCWEHDLWFHVDGAFGAIPALSEALRPRLKGIELADSIAFDFHKWMHVQYDAGFVLIRREDLHREAFTLRREYLTAAPLALSLTEMASWELSDTQTGKNSRHNLLAMFRQSVFGRLAGYEDVNDAG